MKRTFMAFALLGVLALGGCGGKLSIQNPFTANDIRSIQAVYGAALAVAAEYRDLYDRNRCTTTKKESLTNICARRSVVVKMQNAQYAAGVALVNASRFVQDNPALDPTSAISAARLAVNAFKQVTDAKK